MSLKKELEFIDKVSKAMGQGFFLKDLWHQEDLFEMQDKFAKLIVEYSNNDGKIANRFVENFPTTFIKN